MKSCWAMQMHTTSRRYGAAKRAKKNCAPNKYVRWAHRWLGARTSLTEPTRLNWESFPHSIAASISRFRHCIHLCGCSRPEYVGYLPRTRSLDHHDTNGHVKEGKVSQVVVGCPSLSLSFSLVSNNNFHPLCSACERYDKNRRRFFPAGSSVSATQTFMTFHKQFTRTQAHSVQTAPNA